MSISKNQLNHGSLETGLMLIAVGVKVALTERFSFTYVDGSGAQAVAAGIMMVFFGIWFCCIFGKSAHKELLRQMRISIYFIIFSILILLLYLFPLGFLGELFEFFFVVVPLLSGGVGFLFIHLLNKGLNKEGGSLK